MAPPVRLSLSENEWTVVHAIADILIPPVNPEYIRKYIALRQISMSTSSRCWFRRESPNSRGVVDETISDSTVDNIERCSAYIKILSRRSTVFMCAGSSKLFTEKN